MLGPTGREKPAVQLIGADGNAFAMMGTCSRAMKKAGYPEADVNRFYKEAMAGDYDALLRTCMEWCEVE
jgi:hypothetical protein